MPSLTQRVAVGAHSPAAHAANADPAHALVIQRADTWETLPIPVMPFTAYARFAATGERAEYEQHYRERRTRLADLAMAAVLDPDRDTAALADVLWATCDEYQWALPAHIEGIVDTDPPVPHAEQIDLGCAETGAALAEIVQALEHRLPQLVVERVQAAVQQRVIRPFLAREHWWESAPTNWASVCATSVLLAGLALPDVPALERIIERVRSALAVYLSGFDDDGICYEGYSYWYYGFGYFTAAAEALLDHTGGALDLWDDPSGQIAQIAQFPQRMMLSGDCVVSFADAPPRARRDRGLLSKLAERVPGVEVPPARPAADLPETLSRRWALSSRFLRWDTDREVATPERSESSYFAEAQWLIVRDRQEAPSVGFAARGGHNDELHNHNDVGSFILAVDGEILLADPGVGIYDRDYFSDRRYDNPATGSHGHSVPIVDGLRQRGWSVDAEARVLAIQHSPGQARFAIEYASAYDHPDLTELIRTWDFRGEGLSVVDRFTASRPIPVTYRYVSFLPIDVRAAGRAEIVGQRHRLELSFPAGLVASVGRFAGGSGVTDTVHYLDLTGVPLRTGGAAVEILIRPTGN